MFKTSLTAAAFALIAGLSHAAPASFNSDMAAMIPTVEQTSNYCEWITLYDYWGNWVTVWQCY